MPNFDRKNDRTDSMQGSGRPPLEGQLVATIQDNLSLYLHDNAIFLAERLVAEFPSEQNVYLLATCYHRSGQTYRAYYLLRGKCDTVTALPPTTLTSFPTNAHTTYRTARPPESVPLCHMLHPHGQTHRSRIRPAPRQRRQQNS